MVIVGVVNVLLIRVFWALALCALISLPVFWGYAATFGDWDRDAANRNVGLLAIHQWPWAVAVFCQAAALASLSGGSLSDFWKPFLALQAITVLCIVPLPLVLISVALIGDFPWPWLWLLVPVLWLIAAYWISRRIIRRWFSGTLNWQDTLQQKTLLFTVTTGPVGLAAIGLAVHATSIIDL